MNQKAKEWLSQAKYDLETAKAMFDAGRYIYSVYMCHLAIEKGLKAIVAQVSAEVPPKTHNLIYLVKISSSFTIFKKEQIAFLATLNTASITTRYPERLKDSLQKYDCKLAQEYLIKTEDVIKCIIQELKSKK